MFCCSLVWICSVLEPLVCCFLCSKAYVFLSEMLFRNGCCLLRHLNTHKIVGTKNHLRENWRKKVTNATRETFVQCICQAVSQLNNEVIYHIQNLITCDALACMILFDICYVVQPKNDNKKGKGNNNNNENK